MKLVAFALLAALSASSEAGCALETGDPGGGSTTSTDLTPISSRRPRPGVQPIAAGPTPPNPQPSPWTPLDEELPQGSHPQPSPWRHAPGERPGGPEHPPVNEPGAGAAAAAAPVAGEAPEEEVRLHRE
jgi:hypothetical protein